MAKAAMARGLKYIAITDHTKRLAMTHGLDEKRIIEQMAEIDRLNKKLKGKDHSIKRERMRYFEGWNAGSAGQNPRKT